MRDRDHRFLQRRRPLLRAWKVVGPGCVLLVVLLGAFLLVRSPILINPAVVSSGIEHGTIADSTLSLMAVMLPFLFLSVLILLGAIVAVMYGALANERRYFDDRG